MHDTDIPYKFAYAWGINATSGYVNAPVQATGTGAAPSQSTGFNPINSYNPGAGGIPPDIADFNAAFQYFSLWNQWQQVGGPIFYDATLSTNITGYPKGALLLAASQTNWWLSLVDANVTDPDTGGAGWANLSAVPHGEASWTTPGTYSWTCPQGVTSALIDGAGGGAGGGCGNSGSNGGGGGGGGDSIRGYSATVMPGTAYTITIGVGGAGGTSGSRNGVNGSSTNVGALITWSGGTAGAGGGSGGAAGGGGATSGVNGDVSAAGVSFAGAGGSTVFGVGGSGAAGSGVGVTGLFGGVGGGGGAGGSNAGGAGAPGYVKIKW